MLGCLQFALDKRFVDDDFGRDVGQSLLCQASTCFRIGSKFRCVRSTPTEMQSMSENDFECFESTRVNTPETILDQSPRSGDI